jgi:hypothetical protein
MIRKSQLALCALAMLFAASAKAVPVQYYLQNVTFNDGGIASGSFVYDADTNTYSNINIKTTPASTRPAGTFTAIVPGFASSSGMFVASTTAADLTGVPGLNLQFVTPLTNAGGTVNVAPTSVEGVCVNATCAVGMPPFRNVVSGQVSTQGPGDTLDLFWYFFFST